MIIKGTYLYNPIEKMALVSALLIIVTIIFGGCGATATPTSSIKSSQESSILPSVSSQINITPTPNIVNDPDHTLLYELDWSQQSEELQILDQMSLSEFRQKPREDQLKYFSFINHVYFNSFARGGYDVDTKDFIFSLSESASPTDSAEEIVNQAKTNLLVADSAKDEKGAFDSTETRKLLSSYMSDVNFGINPKDDYNFYIEVLDERYATVPQGESSPRVLNYDNLPEKGISRSELKYRNDKTPYVVVLMQESIGSQNSYEFELITFINFRGEDQSIWLMASNSLVEVSK